MDMDQDPKSRGIKETTALGRILSSRGTPAIRAAGSRLKRRSSVTDTACHVLKHSQLRCFVPVRAV